MRALATGFLFQCRILRNSPGQLILLATAPFMTVLFMAIALNAGRSDLAPYAVLAPALIALWGTALQVSGEIVERDKASGALEGLVATPAPLGSIIAGRIAAVTALSLLGFVESWGAAWLVFGSVVPIYHPIAFVGTLLTTSLAMAGTACVMSALFVLTRSPRVFQNSLNYPFYLLGGVMVPVSLLPSWIEVGSKPLFLSWSADLLRDSLAEPEIVNLFARLIAVFCLGAAGYLLGLGLIGRTLRRLRKSGSIGHA